MENDTQVCDLSWNQQEFNDSIEEKTPVGVFSCKGQKLLVYRGKNYVIGRAADADLTIPVKSLSARHIQIEVIGKSHLIKDLGSKNKTMRGELVLIPNVLYELPDNSVILLGDTKASYAHVRGNSTQASWLDMASQTAPNWSSTPAKTVRIQEEVQAVEISADGSSELDAVPPSQFIPQLDESAVLYVEDSPVNSPAKDIPALQIPETPAGPKQNHAVSCETPLNMTQELAKDTSLLNTIKELQTLAQLQGQSTATTVPDSQVPNLTFEEDGSECGSEIVDLNNESGEKGVDSPLKIPETQAVRGESDEEVDGTLDDTNTQCWDAALPSSDSEDEENESRTGEKTPQDERGEKDEERAETEDKKEGKFPEEEECNTSAETMTVSDSETENAGDILPEDARKDDVIPTDEAMIKGAEVTAANSSDMEITCVDQKISSNGDPDTSVLSECLSAGSFSPTSAPPTQVEHDSDATDVDEAVSHINTAAKPGVSTPEESLIESPVMSESELENSLDRKEKYRRSMIQSMEEDSQMWANILSTKTSSSEGNTVEHIVKTPPREVIDDGLEKTPPKGTFDDGLARTPPAKKSPANCSPVTTPSKIPGVEEESVVDLVDISDGNVIVDAEYTQEVMRSLAEGTVDHVGDKNKPGHEEKSMTSSEIDDSGKKGCVTLNRLNNKGGSADVNTDKNAPEKRTPDNSPVADDTEKAVAVVDDDSDVTDIEDAGTAVGTADLDGAKEPVLMLCLDDDDDNDNYKIDDDSLQITEVHEACSLEITHVNDVTQGNGKKDEGTNDDDLQDTPCTLDLDVKFVSGTDEFDVKVKGEPATEEDSDKAFISMFDPEDGDAPVFDSQLNTLNTLGDEAAMMIKSPIKRPRPTKSPAKKGPGRKGKQPKAVAATKPRASRTTREAALDTSESEDDTLLSSSKSLASNKSKRGASGGKADSAPLSVVKTRVSKARTGVSEVSKVKEVTEVSEEPPPSSNTLATSATRGTILKLDSVEELLRKRREVKQKLDAKKMVSPSRSKNKGKKKATKLAGGADDEDDLPEFGLMDSFESETEEDEVVELDLITSSLKSYPSTAAKEGPSVPDQTVLKPERKRRPPIRKPSVSAQKELDANSADFQRPSRARQSKRIFSDSDENPVSFDGPGDSLESRDSTNSTEKKETEQSPVAEETHAKPGMKRKPPVSKATMPAKKDKVETLNTNPKRPSRARKAEAILSDSEESHVEERDNYSLDSMASTTSSTRSTKKNKVPVNEHSPPPVVEASPRPSRIRNKTMSSEASPAPTHSKRGRLRKVKSDVREFLDDAKKELEPRTIRGRRNTVPVKEEVVEENISGNVVAEKVGRGGKGKGALKRGVKQEAESKQEQEVKREPSPVITIGRGKRKKTSAPKVKDEEQSPVASIVNKSFKPPSPATPSRRATSITRLEIVYTGITPSDAMKRSIAAMGGVMSEDVTTCSHLVTDKIKRTAKFLCAIGRGIPIVSENWLKESKKFKNFLEASDFAIKDSETERKYKFVLTKSLDNANQSPFLSGWNVFVTKTCQPTPEQFQCIISCNGGFMLKRAPKASDTNVIIIATDRDNLKTLSKNGHPICSTELILTGALRQELAVNEFNLRQKSPEL